MWTRSSFWRGSAPWFNSSAPCRLRSGTPVMLDLCGWSDGGVPEKKVKGDGMKEAWWRDSLLKYIYGMWVKELPWKAKTVNVSFHWRNSQSLSVTPWQTTLPNKLVRLEFVKVPFLVWLCQRTFLMCLWMLSSLPWTCTHPSPLPACLSASACDPSPCPSTAIPHTGESPRPNLAPWNKMTKREKLSDEETIWWNASDAFQRHAEIYFIAEI